MGMMLVIRNAIVNGLFGLVGRTWFIDELRGGIIEPEEGLQ